MKIVEVPVRPGDQLLVLPDIHFPDQDDLVLGVVGVGLFVVAQEEGLPLRVEAIDQGLWQRVVLQHREAGVAQAVHEGGGRIRAAPVDHRQFSR